MAIGATIGSALIGASSANKAAKSQERVGREQIALQERIYDEQTGLFRPAYDEGRDYAAVRNYLDGIGPLPTMGGTAPLVTTTNVPGALNPNGGGVNMSRKSEADGTFGQGIPAYGPGRTEYSVGGNTFNTLDDATAWANANKEGGTPFGGFQKTPGYQFAVDQGIAALEAGAAARGGLYSGKTMQDLQDYGQGMANQEFNNYYNRIAGGAQAGQAAAGQQAQAGQNFATGSSNALANIGNAQAAGAIGVGNALQNGINNGLGLFQYQRNMNTGGGATNANVLSAPWGSGGFW